MTSGARTRRASSSSSCPVSSPSSTTIVLTSTFADTSREHAEEGGLETAGLERTLPLRRRARKRDQGRREARALSWPGDPPGVERRLDLPQGGGEAAGDRSRRCRAPPV